MSTPPNTSSTALPNFPIPLPQKPSPVIGLDANGQELGTLANPVFIEPTGTGTQPVNIVGGSITATNPSVSNTGAAVPTQATAIGIEDGSSNLQLVSASNPLPITGTISVTATNPSVGTIGSTVPTSATAVGWKDGSGNLQDVSAANPLPITGSISASNPSVASTGGATPASATLIGGTDGTDLRGIATDSSGQVKVLVENSVAVTGTFFQTTQPVSLTSTTITGSVAVTGTFFQATQPVSLTTLPALVAGSAIIGKVGIDQTTPGTTNLVSIGTNGTVALNAAIPAGANLIGKTGIDQTTPGTTNKVSIGTDGTVAIGTALPAGTNVIGHAIVDSGTITTVSTVTAVTTLGTITNTVPTKQIPQTSGGLGLPFSASVTTKAQVKGSAGQLYAVWALNNTAAIAYIQVFNLASASVTLGTTTPDYVLPLPASSGATIALDLGCAHGTGITVACTTTRGGSTTAACDVVIWFD